jgi:hypothetical protein
LLAHEHQDKVIVTRHINTGTSTSQHIMSTQLKSHQRINTSTHQRINTSTRQRAHQRQHISTQHINASTHQHANTSTPQRINASTHQHQHITNTSTLHNFINTPTPQNSHQHINTPTQSSTHQRGFFFRETLQEVETSKLISNATCHSIQRNFTANSS